jgi:hypothetical protein
MTSTPARKQPEREHRPAPPPKTPIAAPVPARPPTGPNALLALQGTAGNAAVSALVAGRGEATAPDTRQAPPSPVVARAEESEDEGGSWWSRAKALVRMAMQMKDLLSGVLGKAAGVVGSIVKSPVAFLGNLVAGVKGGIMRFRQNITEHLKRGLMGWLLGALTEGGVALPATWDVKGIVGMLASVFGLTWNAIRSRVVAKIGEKAMGAVEKSVQVFQLLKGEGVAGLWQMLLDKLGNVQEMILGRVREFVISKVITAGITWLIGILNPAAGIIKALKLIYDVVMFFKENAARLARFVETVLDSVTDVARGSVGAVVTKIENVLGGMIPTLIGFLASVVGLGGVGAHVRRIVESLRAPVRRGMDALIAVGLRLARPLLRRLASRRNGRRASSRTAKTGQPQKLANEAARAGHEAIDGATPSEAPRRLQQVLATYSGRGVRTLSLLEKQGLLHVKATVNPERVYHKGLWVTVGPLAIREIVAAEKNTLGSLTGDELDSGYSTTARGSFLYNGRGHEIESMKSSEKRKYRRQATRSEEGAHAEAQVINAFTEIYDNILRAGPTSRQASSLDIELSVDVSRGSCPSCATQMARFVERMRADGCIVRTSVRFGGVYHSPRAATPPEGVPEDKLRGILLKGGQLRAGSASPAGALGAGVSSSSGGLVIPRGINSGRYAIARLTAAGVDVQVLEERDVKDISTKNAARLSRRRLKLRHSIDSVRALLGKG